MAQSGRCSRRCALGAAAEGSGPLRHGIYRALGVQARRRDYWAAAYTYSSHDAPEKIREIYRDAGDAALKRCSPLHFGSDMAQAVVGHPIAIRFVDNRTADKTKTQQ
jgi:hypothetical protein